MVFGGKESKENMNFEISKVKIDTLNRFHLGKKGKLAL